MTCRLAAALASAVLLLGCHADDEPTAPTRSGTLAETHGAPRGFLENPRIAAYDPFTLDSLHRPAATKANLDFHLVFSGWVDFPPGEGEVEIVADDYGDSYPGNGSTLVATAAPSSVTKVVNGRKVWTFAIGPFQPFREVVRQKSHARPWRDGGTAKISVFARRFRDGQSTQLRGRDGDGIRGVPFGPTVVLADRKATPFTQSSYVQPEGGLYRRPGFLKKKEHLGGTGFITDTEDYYRSVHTTADGTRRSGWTIWRQLRTLDAFRERYFRLPAACPSPATLVVDAPPATYFNKGDLGIGREMHCSHNACTRETACYVRNFGSPDGTPHFSLDMTQSKEALERNRPFATVAMVSRGLMPAGAANKVFFAVYHPGGQLALSALLDSPKGDVFLENNTFIPGNCLVCHGGAARYVRETRQVFHAEFLPFDLQHGIAFYGEDPSDPLSREEQESRFRTLNRIVATTDLYALEHARRLLNGFYGAGPDAQPADWGPAFQDDWTPPEWVDQSRSQRQLYRHVIAPFCRTCHVSHPSLHFGSYGDFVAHAFRIERTICTARDKDIMPNAQITAEALWRSDARAQLVNRALFPGCGLLGPGSVAAAQD